MIIRFLEWMYRLYRRCVSPFFGERCRFYPCCSYYAISALKEHGLCIGFLLTAKRVCRCGPWSSGGLDPVPPRGTGGKFF